MPISWTCNQLDATTSECLVTSSSTPEYNFPFTHAEFLLVVMIFILLLSIPFWRFIIPIGK